MADPIALRPAAEGDLDVIESLTQDPEAAGEFGWLGWHHTGLRANWAQNGLLSEHGGTLVIAAGPRCLGFMNWRSHPAGRAGCYYEIGIALLPGARGHGYGTEAHRLLARYLFAHTTVYRLQADTDTGNIAEQRALEKAGFAREGVRRGLGWRDGAWRDGVTYSLLRTDPVR
jgi:RimJ/RimL family protein N-acetyltransferase